MTAPLPKLRSICPSAVSRACSRSNFIDLLAGLASRTSYCAPPGTQPGNENSGVGRSTTTPSSGSRGRSRGRSRKRSTVTCGSHGRRLAAVDAERLERAVEPAGERRSRARPRRRRRACRRSASRGSRGRGEARSGAAAAAEPASASAIAASVSGRPGAEERQRDVEVLARDDRAAAVRARSLPGRELVERRRSGRRSAQKRRRRSLAVHASAEVVTCLSQTL